MGQAGQAGQVGQAVQAGQAGQVAPAGLRGKQAALPVQRRVSTGLRAAAAGVRRQQDSRTRRLQEKTVLWGWG